MAPALLPIPRPVPDSVDHHAGVATGLLLRHSYSAQSRAALVVNGAFNGAPARMWHGLWDSQHPRVGWSTCTPAMLALMLCRWQCT